MDNHYKQKLYTGANAKQSSFDAINVEKRVFWNIFDYFTSTV